jgi:hypothetical protein
MRLSGRANRGSTRSRSRPRRRLAATTVAHAGGPRSDSAAGPTTIRQCGGWSADVQAQAVHLPAVPGGVDRTVHQAVAARRQGVGDGMAPAPRAAGPQPLGTAVGGAPAEVVGSGEVLALPRAAQPLDGDLDAADAGGRGGAAVPAAVLVPGPSAEVAVAVAPAALVVVISVPAAVAPAGLRVPVVLAAAAVAESLAVGEASAVAAVGATARAPTASRPPTSWSMRLGMESLRELMEARPVDRAP